MEESRSDVAKWSKPPAGVAVGIVLLYLVGRIVLDHLWQSIDVKISYVVEAFFVLTVGSIYRERVVFTWPNRTSTLLDLALPFAAGALISFSLGEAEVKLPFDFSNPLVLVAALIIAPTLEEGIFRLALWEPLRDLFDSDRWALVLTTLIFAAAHGVVFYQIPVEYRPFVIIQVLYVVLLGLATGARRIQTNGSIIAPILVHACFNLGFHFGL